MAKNSRPNMVTKVDLLFRPETNSARSLKRGIAGSGPAIDSRGFRVPRVRVVSRLAAPTHQ